MKERLTVLKTLCDKCVTLMKNDYEIYGDFQHKNNFPSIFISTDNPING